MIIQTPKWLSDRSVPAIVLIVCLVIIGGYLAWKYHKKDGFWYGVLAFGLCSSFVVVASLDTPSVVAPLAIAAPAMPAAPAMAPVAPSVMPSPVAVAPKI